MRCRGCGHIIYDGPFKGTDLIFADIRKRNYGRVRCPGCDRKLTLKENVVTISPAEGVKP